MNPLTKLLYEEAEKRNLLTTEKIDVPAAFYLIRDMDYKRASDREPKTTILEWRGTCSGKHYLFKSVLNELGYTSKLMACTLYIPVQAADRFPSEMRLLFDDGPIPDVHNFILLPTDMREMLIDATWPKSMEALGLPINEFVWGQDMKMAAKPINTYVVPDDIEPQTFKDELLKQHFSEQELKRRDLFFQSLGV